MNMHAKPELFAPCFPIFELVAESIEVEADMVRFTLQYGAVEIDCEAQADELTDSTCVNRTNDPQNDVEVDYARLEVDDRTPVTVIRTDADLVDGQKIKLTEQQVEKLNQQLEWICIEKFEMEMAA
ncbi:hypothetical protein HLH10_04705 [Acinetobacter sp. ANC 4277]|uniref:hypothetical protein n=1 Tax=Acinetobacter terrae TaxID=2731247 RepID=UPI0014907230|nr:hypothetical protein [Acinetobacter terrae]NNG75633.1 hypothetical protein [Acinetobacter terrae]